MTKALATTATASAGLPLTVHFTGHETNGCHKADGQYVAPPGRCPATACGMMVAVNLSVGAVVIRIGAVAVAHDERFPLLVVGIGRRRLAEGMGRRNQRYRRLSVPRHMRRIIITATTICIASCASGSIRIAGAAAAATIHRTSRQGTHYVVISRDRMIYRQGRAGLSDVYAT